MEFYARIAIFMMIFCGLSAAAVPDWSCDFEVDDCGIMNLDGMWARTRTSGGADVLSAIVSGSMSSDDFTFSIPYNFTSPRGNLSFDYFIAGVGSMLLVTVCREHEGPVVEFVHTGLDPLDSSTKIPYSCANKMDVEIIFNAKRGSVAPTVRLDNIQIFETPYTVSNETTTVPAATLTTVKGVKTSTEMVTDETRPTQEKSTTKEGATPAPQRGDNSWLIPVVATIAVLFVITLLVLIGILSYRRRAERLRPMTSGATCKGVDKHVVEGQPVLNRKSNQAKKSKPDIGYYANLRNDPEKNKQGIRGDGSVKGKLEANSSPPSAADAFKVQNGSNIMDGDLVGNPVYESGDADPTEVKDDAYQSFIINPLFKGPDKRKQESVPSDDHADTPLCGNGTDIPNHEDLNESNTADGRPNNVRHQVRGKDLYALVSK